MTVITYDTVRVRFGEAWVETDIVEGDEICGFDTVVDGDGSASTRAI